MQRACKERELSFLRAMPVATDAECVQRTWTFVAVGWADHALGVDRSSGWWRHSARHPGRQHVGRDPDELPRRCSTHVEDDNHFLEVVGFHFESAGIGDNEFTAGGFS